ncbi:MAG TPA: AAA family ATPase [Solirubrobacteraceae bacterium]|nr:AAA family ATPase [Solirubrobacteraceae bacterium]
MPSATGIVGRDSELAAVRRFASPEASEWGGCLIRGEAGIGKTVLWRAGVETARVAGTRVLTVRCAEAELPMALAGLCDALDPVLDEVSDRLAETQRAQLSVALGRAVDDGVRPDRLALARATAAALRLVADRGPVLLAVDDVQWLDPASARILSFALRRLAGSSLRVLATQRASNAMEEPLNIRSAYSDAPIVEVELGPLTVGAIGHLVRSRGSQSLSRPLLLRLHDASGGNPMYALEYAASVGDAQPATGGRLSMPASLRDLVRNRVANLPAVVMPLLELVAVLERPTVPQLEHAFVEEDCAAILDEAAGAGAIAVGEDGIVRLTHPLLAAAVYEKIAPARRRMLHLRAAELVSDEEERARHIALATFEPSEEIAQMLDAAAARAAARGAPEAAAELERHALRLTLESDEESRHRRLLAGALHLVEAGDTRQAQERIAVLLAPAIPADMRAQALLCRAESEFRDRRQLVRFLQDALEAARDESRARWHALIRLAHHGAFVSGDAVLASETATAALELALELEDAGLVEESAGLVSFHYAVRGQPEPTVPPVAGASARTDPRLPPWFNGPELAAGWRALWAADLPRARDVLRARYDRLSHQGSTLKLPFTLIPLIELEWRAGNWDLAETYHTEAESILGDILVLAYTRVLLAGSRGHLDEARARVADALADAERQNDHLAPLRNLWALGLLELSAGEPAAAWTALAKLPEQIDTFGIREPSVCPALPEAIEALVELDRADEARALLRRFEEQATGLSHLWAEPAIRRCRGLLALTEDRLPAALSEFDAASEAFRAIGQPLDAGRSLLGAGAALRRTGERLAAAARIEAAAAIFDELGAPVWRERAHAELRRSRPRPRRDDGLTAAEAQVASLVGAGRTNKEVAAQLFMAISTVEAHLTRIYRKLGVRSRSELTRRIADGALESRNL